MKIHKIDTSLQSDVKKFKEFPFELYNGCDYWVPTMDSEITLALDRNKHPFYKHSEADFFIAETEGQVIGRIGAIYNQNYNHFHKSSIGFFYYFDTVDDLEVSNTLFDTVVDWTKQHGAKYILGPKGMLRSNGVGLLVEGFDHLPAMGNLYNYPYYQKHLEKYGFVKEYDHLTGFMDSSYYHFPEKLYQVAEKVKKRGSFWIKTFTNKAEMEKWIPVLETVHHEAFVHNPGYYPSTKEEFELLAKLLIRVIDPRLPKLIMKDNDVAGFILPYPNINRGVQKAKGRILPFGWYHLLREQHRTRTVDINGLGLLPKYQGLGGNALLYTELEKTILQYNFERVEIVQVDERNFMSKSDMETLGTNWYKCHRTYRLDI